MVLRYHPRFGHLYVPNLTARIPSERGGYLIRTNSMGLRSDLEFQRTRGSQPRILFFGDSFTAGDGCDNAERFPELVGQSLDAEVYNFGLSGSGTDQQLLMYEELAREIEADLLVLCVVVHNIERITVSHRKSIDRVSGRQILVPKPFFSLEDGELRPHQIPVPVLRPEAVTSHPGNGDMASTWLNDALNAYRSNPALARVRRLAGDPNSAASIWLRSQALKLTGFQPHPAYQSPDTPGWRLMEALLRRFAAGGLPVLVVPLPTYYFYLYGVKPDYQQLYSRLAEPRQGVHVADLTSPLRALPVQERVALTLREDGHFSPEGHRRIAGLITEQVTSRRLLPTAAARVKPPRAPAVPARKPLAILGISCYNNKAAGALTRAGRIRAPAS
jgi:carbamoyltransferase